MVQLFLCSTVSSNIECPISLSDGEGLDFKCRHVVIKRVDQGG